MLSFSERSSVLGQILFKQLLFNSTNTIIKIAQMYVWIFLTEGNNRTAKNDETNLSSHILKLEKYFVQAIQVFQHCRFVLRAENILGTHYWLIVIKNWIHLRILHYAKNVNLNVNVAQQHNISCCNFKDNAPMTYLLLLTKIQSWAE